jgi:hypothetical protein
MRNKNKLAAVSLRGAAMSYVEENLIPGELVIHSTGLHWIVLAGPFAAGIVLE